MPELAESREEYKIRRIAHQQCMNGSDIRVESMTAKKDRKYSTAYVGQEEVAKAADQQGGRILQHPPGQARAERLLENGPQQDRRPRQ
jgi:hypothetical protein